MECACDWHWLPWAVIKIGGSVCVRPTILSTEENHTQSRFEIETEANYYEETGK